ncbi:hypothetical protein K488DRAFT_53419 [Vararia minispora EC-137]|uniref:Uncharacterized protein n=1 Tax=Vararia minispora EC-137 TaxID=1314806 RepID=A0ACB8QG72_9AGAM|nr:hypothetical protein K488DRAFT_53419 [Vararia minispora EC-137]
MAISLDLPERATSLNKKSLQKLGRKAFKGLMRSQRMQLTAKYDFPLRIRWWFVLITGLVMVTLAFLGLTNWAHALPVNDKLLHFVCLGLATFLFYFITDVEEDARRIWFWHRAPLILTSFVCLFLGGIASEFVQSLLPYKNFQFGDIVANLLGSSIGLLSAYHAERYHRHRREISRLYRPISTSASSLHLPSDSEDGELLPIHNTPGVLPKHKTRGRADSLALADVWGEREEVFDVGEDESEGENTSAAGKVVRNDPSAT